MECLWNATEDGLGLLLEWLWTDQLHNAVWRAEMTKNKNEAAIDYLRRMVRYFDSQHEGFNSNYTLLELLKIWAFVDSDQGGCVAECCDTWPTYLLKRVLLGKAGKAVAADIVKRASDECY